MLEVIENVKRKPDVIKLRLFSENIDGGKNEV